MKLRLVKNIDNNGNIRWTTQKRYFFFFWFEYGYLPGNPTEEKAKEAFDKLVENLKNKRTIIKVVNV
jgi:hypothetical protein